MSKIEKIFIPTKFEDLSFLVVQQLLALKAAGLQELHFLHVIDRDEVSFYRYEGFDEELAEKLRHEADQRFTDWEKQLDTHGVKSRHQIEVGRPSTQILEAAEAAGADLIVAGRQRETPLDKVYMGGTSMDILRQSRVPVMICKPTADDRQADDRVTNPFQRILLATDFSDVSEHALDFVTSLDGAVEEVDLVHVLHDRDVEGHDEGGRQSLQEKAKEQLASAEKTLSDSFSQVRTHLRAGRTSEEILRMRTECDATLVVMGTTGKHGLREIWLGSASHRVAENSDVPVVLVPAPA